MFEPAGAAPQPKRSPNYALTYVAVFMAMGVGAGVVLFRLVPGIESEIPDRPLSEEDKDGVFDCLRNSLMNEAAARECVQAYGSQALLFYHAVIQDSAERGWVRANACMLAGLYGDSATPALIIDFVEELIQPGIASPGLSSVAIALDGLGLTGQESAMTFLERLASPVYWDDRGVALHDETDGAWGRNPQVIRKRAIRALGLAPNGLGMASLERLRSEAPGMEDELDQALADARKRR